MSMHMIGSAGGGGATWRRMTGSAVMGAVTAALAAIAMAVPADAAVTASAAAPVGTIRITNANQSLTAGVVNAGGRGNVFTTVGGNQQVVQQWNHIDGGKLVSRGRSQGTTRCLESGGGGSVFIAPCAAGRNSQKWAFKPAGKRFRIQNFQTKKCLKIGATTPQLTAAVSAVECKAQASQTWFATQAEPGDF
ncbi:ricin-type beta-trefoil lectin domain protein [Streptosporangium sp. CA-135522]|uniref:ricin-type beta-trefoil lectin domain protein n=1 Tax=Streptosporangium sp. CA-135522 TaxID=3240072 RepID=UPI003D8C78B7